MITAGRSGRRAAAALALLAVPVPGLGACAGRRAAPERRAGGEYGVLLPDSVRDALLVAARDVARGLRDTTTACVAYVAGHANYRVDRRSLQRLGPGRRFVALGDCPPTYASMIRYVDSLGRALGPTRPAGYVDPYSIGLVLPVRWSEGTAYVDVRIGQGTGGREFACVVRRRDRERTATCRLTRSWLS
jgi:hypothetical protein